MDVQKYVTLANQARTYFNKQDLKAKEVEIAVAICLAKEIQPELQVSVDADVVQSGYISNTIRPNIALLANSINEEVLINVDVMEACATSLFQTRTRIALGHITGDAFHALMGSDSMMADIKRVGWLKPVEEVLKKDFHGVVATFLRK